MDLINIVNSFRQTQYIHCSIWYITLFYKTNIYKLVTPHISSLIFIHPLINMVLYDLLGFWSHSQLNSALDYGFNWYCRVIALCCVYLRRLMEWFCTECFSKREKYWNIVLYFSTSYSSYYFYLWVEQQADYELTFKIMKLNHLF